MQKIIWDMGIVGIMSDSINAELHKHWALQLFYSPDGNMNLTVNGESVAGNLIIVAPNTSHSFSSNKQVYFSMLILPGSRLYDHIVHKFLSDC